MENEQCIYSNYKKCDLSGDGEMTDCDGLGDKNKCPHWHRGI